MARAAIGVAAAAFIAYAVGLVLGGGHFPPPGEPGAVREHVLVFVAVTLAVSFLHLLASLLAQRAPPRLFYVILVGAAARLILLFGDPAPILEGDHARIRLEGRLVNLGIHPYAFRPVQLMDGGAVEGETDVPDAGRLAAARARLTASADAPRPEQVLRPDLRPTSAPLGLWSAALADRFKPQSTRGFAFVILCADVVAAFFILMALRALRLPPGWLIVYAWCPVLLKEAYSTLAPAVLLLPALAAAAYCLVSGRRLLAAIPLAAGVALQPVLVLLLPVLGRRIGVPALLLVLVLAALPALPFALDAHVPAQHYVESAVHAWRYQEYNSVAENLLRGALRHMPYRTEDTLYIAGVEMFGPGQRVYELYAKLGTILLLLCVLTYALIRLRPEAESVVDERRWRWSDLFLGLVILLAVSPVLQPQHVLWLLPLLAIRPIGMAWLALPGLVSLCYLTHIDGPQQADFLVLGGRFSFRLFEYGGFLVLLACDLLFRTTSLEDEEDAVRLRLAAEGTTVPASRAASREEEAAELEVTTFES